MRKKTSTIMAWLLAASVTVTSLSAGTVTAYEQEEMPLVEAGTVTVRKSLATAVTALQILWERAILKLKKRVS